MGKRVNTAVWMEKYQRWQIKVQKDGVRKTFYSSKPGRAGQREANAKADKWLDEGIENSGKKVSQMYEAFLEAQKKATSHSNWVNLESLGRIWILPEIGHRKMSNLTEQHLQGVLNNACAKKRSKKTVMNIRAALTSFLKFCRKSKATTLVPEDLALAKSLRYCEKRVLQPEDLKTLFEVDTSLYRGKKIFDDLIYAYRLQVLLGLRPGELLAIERKNIVGSTLYIKHAINKYGEKTNGKNGNAVRAIGLSKTALDIIEAQKSLVTSNFLFEHITQGYYYKRWKNYCESNNMGYVSPYELRHTFVSLAKKLPEGDVKAIVGHSKDMDTFGIYGHEIEGDRKRVADEIESIFKIYLGKGKAE